MCGENAGTSTAGDVPTRTQLPTTECFREPGFRGKGEEGGRIPAESFRSGALLSFAIGDSAAVPDLHGVRRKKRPRQSCLQKAQKGNCGTSPSTTREKKGG